MVGHGAASLSQIDAPLARQVPAAAIPVKSRPFNGYPLDANPPRASLARRDIDAESACQRPHFRSRNRETEGDTGVEVDVKLGLKPDELKAIIGDYAALAVRSETKVTADILAAAKNLQIIGRAGVGVDNIDVTAATQKGIVVVNSPEGNTLAAAELAVALLLALARNIPQADASLRAGKWERKKFVGTEIYGKTVGIIGLGKIGRERGRSA